MSGQTIEGRWKDVKYYSDSVSAKVGLAVVLRDSSPDVPPPTPADLSDLPRLRAIVGAVKAELEELAERPMPTRGHLERAIAQIRVIVEGK